MVLQVGGLDLRLTTLLCKKITVAKSKDGIIPTNRQIWQNILRKGIAQKELFLPMTMIRMHKNSVLNIVSK
jgi:hypothetical protein